MDEIVTSVQTETPTVESKPEAPITDYTSHKTLYEMFSADKTERVETAFKMIWQYATEHAENKDFDSIKYEVIKLKNRLGSPHIGEPSYSKLERYVSAYYDLKRAEERLNEVS